MASSGAQRRVWVKRVSGYPTSIMTSRYDIVDDLKAAAFSKYPNTLAKMYDSSEIRIFVVLQKREQMQGNKNLKSKALMNRLKNESNDDPNYRNSMLNDIISDTSLALLEPDKNVWEVLDEYFESDMRMSDAFLIDATREKLPQILSKTNFSEENLDDIRRKDFEKNFSPSPSHSSLKQSSLAMSTLQTPKLHNPHQNSKVLEKHSPDFARQSMDASSFGLNHKRSGSSPSQSPISLTTQSKNNNSRAVLLLPRNFSLGEQSSLKKLGENMIHRPGYKSKSVMSTPEDTTEKKSALNSETNGSIEESEEKNEEFLAPTDEKSDKTASKKVLNQQESRRPKVDKTLNTSTFEQVLPSISVLVVEDNSINQAILGAFLRKHKIHYQIAKNGQEAVDKWRKGGFHLVLMDIQLPVKSGIEVTKEIRLLERINRIGVFAQHELSNSHATGNLEIREDQKLDLNMFRSPVIIVALTASSNSSVDRKNALTAGCNDYLTKPVNLVWLQNKITEWGCMQALIDFDGWRCKGNSKTLSLSKGVSST
ncbi:hypothetical protein METBIDRAFT_78241 [Metschnikowia bicuspidata var. bicuspidata NRRL YB-4993]|uniref:Response regulatory domain-containing protein n=1 Tax=Metschnikowia bicuspidata var. bicuspidata NRRL YB-4993 TaxID=869754 RepID=A0A1A0HBE9_9ASCO|nr:hypothetical protein METBIDRAFT_78241 [Metschnikowia bicuspidata var. bicuspidata NRRL YB-4993]OBA21202.1 hypothetical protein METBIDRAFT_78241 [Metschnikowia bicuspidata var. bicuspidata NRRL YB-4993]